MKQRLFAAIMGLLLMACPPVFAVEKALLDLSFEKKLQLARAGDPEAKLAVAEAYQLGQGVHLNASEAAKWYREAALAGVLDAQFRLAKMVSAGAPGLKPDKDTAIKLLAAAAQKGHAPSQNQYGFMLQTGDGVARDMKAAADWYRQAAEQGLAEAQNNLGVMLLNGWGVERNLDDAFKWISKSATQNYGWGLNNLGGLYEKGWGTPKDLKQAAYYYELAGNAGLPTGSKNFERLKSSAASSVSP